MLKPLLPAAWTRAWLPVLLVVCALLALTHEQAAAKGAPKPIGIVTPAGGELYVIGSTQRIRLSPKTRARSVTIELSTDAGATFAPLGTIDNTVADRSLRNVLPFTVPGPASGRCMVRASADGAVTTVSPGFSVGAATVAEGPFVSRTGDDVTGPLNVAGPLGVGTTTPRATVEVSDPAEATLLLAGAPSSLRYLFTADAAGLRLTEETDLLVSPKITIDDASGDMRFGGNGSVNCNGDGSVRIDGALTLEANLFTANFTANNATCVFLCNSANNDITITLPATAPPTGRLYVVKKTSANNTVTIAGNGRTIDGAASVAVTANYAFRILIFNGTNWSVIGQ